MDDDKVNQHEGTSEEKGEGLGGEQTIGTDTEEQGKGARLDQAAPTPEKQMETEPGTDAEVSTGTNPTPTKGGAGGPQTQQSPGESDSGSA